MSRMLPERGLGSASPKWHRRLWMVLIVYRVLKVLVGKNRALTTLLTILSYRFRKHTQAYLEERFGITQDEPEKAFECIAQNFKARGEQLFGPGWIYVEGIQDSNHSFTDIHRCFFNDFFSVP